MKLINNDDFVAPLKATNLILIQTISDYIGDAFQLDVYLFETIHGHIVTFRKKEGRYHGKGPERLDNKDLKFYSKLSEKIRWVELGHYEISIGLKRCK